MGVCTCNTLFSKKSEVTIVHDKPKSANQFVSQLNTNRQDNASQHYNSDFKMSNSNNIHIHIYIFLNHFN